MTGFPLSQSPTRSSSPSSSSCSWTTRATTDDPRRPTCRRCGRARSSPPTSPSRSPTRASRTTRWCGSTRRSAGSPATPTKRRSGATAASCRGRRPIRGRSRGSARRWPSSGPVTVDAAQLPQGRHRVLEPAVGQPGVRRRRRAGQLRRACRPTSPSGCGSRASARPPSPRSRAARQEAELARAIAEQARADAERARPRRDAQNRLALMAEATSSLMATLDMGELLDRLAGLLRPAAGRLGVHHPGRRLRRPADGAAAPGRPGRGAEPSSSRCRRRTCRRTPRPGAAWPRRARCSSSGSPTTSIARALRLAAAPRSCSARWAARSLADRADGRPAADARRDGPGARRRPSARSRRRTSTSPRTSPAAPPSRWTTCGSTSRSTRSPTRCSARCCPTCPRSPGHRSAAHYVSASTAADVGGDFYDLLALPDGSVGHGHRRRRRPRRRRRGGDGPPARPDPGLRLGRRRPRPGGGAQPGGPAGAGAAGRRAGHDGLRPGAPGRRPRAARGGCRSATPGTRRCCCARPTAECGSSTA